MAESAARQALVPAQAAVAQRTDEFVTVNPNKTLLESGFEEMSHEEAAKLRKRYDNAERTGFRFSALPRKRTVKER